MTVGSRGQAVDRVGVRLETIVASGQDASAAFRDGDILAVKQRLAAIRDEINRSMPVLNGRVR